MRTSAFPEAGRAGPLFRHFICRVSGLPADALDALADPLCARILNELAEVEGALAGAREAMSQRLHAAVQAARDPAGRRALLDLRRSLYNLRTPGPAVRSGALVALGGGDAAVEKFDGWLQARDRLLAELGPAYARGVREARRRFRALLDDDGFQKGLLLSSRALFEAQARYRRPDGEPAARLEKTERGLLRYFSRTCMKATPFSTLCSLVPGELADANGGTSALTLTGDPLAKRSATRLNKALFGVLMDALLRRPGFREHARVELNPTLAEEDGHYVYLTALRGKETFVRLPHSATVAHVAELVRASPGTPRGVLARALAAHRGIEASDDEARSYLDALLAGGFLRFDTGVKEQDVDWDLSFRRVLEGVDDVDAARVAELLATLRALAGRYDAAGAGERREVLDAARDELGHALPALGVRGRFGQLPFMEDATAGAAASLPDTPALRELERCLAELLHRLRPAAYPRGPQAELRHFFERYYPPGTGAVPLLRFYEDFHREHEKPHLARVARGAGEEPYDLLNPLGLALVDAIRRGERRLLETVSRRWEAAPAAEEIDLEPADLDAAFAEIPPLPTEGFSLSVFAEVVPGRDPGPALRLIVPGRISVGYGRLFSRFVYLLPDQVQHDLRAAAATLSPARAAEIGGDSGHNANLHPPLLGWEIRYPTVQAGIAEHQLAPTELFVEPAPGDPHALVLRHAGSGHRVVPIDLGFTVRESRPPLYQLLSRFMPPCEYQHRWPAYPGHVPLELRERADEGGSADGIGTTTEGAPEPPWARVLCRPRITYGGTLVLARRSWRVPAWHLPQLRPGETEPAFFLRVDRWRRAHGLPREAYVRVWPDFLAGQAMGQLGSRGGLNEAGEGDEGGDAAEGAASRGSPSRYDRGTLNLRKPQYVDFGSPLLVSLFGRLAGDLETFVAMVEERYPEPRDLPRCAGRPYAVEQMFQLDFPLAVADDAA